MGDWWDPEYDPYAKPEEEEQEETAFSDPSTELPTEPVEPLGPEPVEPTTPADIQEYQQGQQPTTPPAVPPAAPPAAGDQHEVTYEPIYDAEGKIVGYNMMVNGEVQQTFDYSDLYERLQGVEQPSTIEEWMQRTGFNIQDIEGTPEYAGLAALIAKLQDPNTTTEDARMAEEEAARAMGYGSAAEMLADLEQRRTATAGGYQGMQGMNQQEISAYDRRTQAVIRQQQTNMRRAIDQVLSGAVGNSTKNGLMTANEYISQIRDTQIQADWQLAAMQFERQTKQFDEQWQMYKDLYDRGQATEQQIYDSLYKNRMGALQGYATQVTALMNQNQQYLNMYSADLDRVRLAADEVYNGVQAELGINADLRDSIADSFSQYWAEIMAPINYENALEEQRAAQAAKSGSIWSMVLGGLGFIAGLILTPFTGGASLALSAAGIGAFAKGAAGSGG